MSILKRIFKLKDTVAVIAGILFVTKLLGFVKFRLIAGYFGASKELDIFWAAFLIPDTLFNILIAGSVNAAIIPVFSDVLYKDGEKRLVKLMSATIFAMSIIFVLLSVLIFIFARDVSGFLVDSGYIHSTLSLTSTLNSTDIDLLTQLMRIMLLSPILLGISSVVTAFLQVHKRFFITTLAPLLYNLGMIGGTWVMVGGMNAKVPGLAWSVVIGSALHLIVQLPITYQFIRIHLRIRDIGNINGQAKFYTKEILHIFRLAIPRIIAYVGEQINVIINTIISFSLTEGALSAYRFAISLHLFPVHIFAGAFAQVSLPQFAEDYAKNDMQAFKNSFNKALTKMMFVVLPSVAILVILRLPIVRLAYGTGKFDWWDTVVTSWALALLGLAIIGQSVVALTLRALYAVHETRLPLVATIITVIVNIAGSYYFTNFFSHYQDWRPIISQVTSQLAEGISAGGIDPFLQSAGSLWGDLGKWFTTRNVYDASVGGLSLSLSVAFFIEMVLNLYFLSRKVKIVCWDTLIAPITKMTLNTLVMSGFMYFVFRLTDFSLDTTRTIYLAMVLFVTSFVGGVVYVLMSFTTNVKEVELIADKGSKLLQRIPYFSKKR